jgi:hypothetical protein
VGRLSALCTGCNVFPRNITIFLFLVPISVKRVSEPQGLVQLEGLGKLKNFTSSGLEPATFWLVAERINLYTTMCPHIYTTTYVV